MLGHVLGSWRATASQPSDLLVPSATFRICVGVGLADHPGNAALGSSRLGDAAEGQRGLPSGLCFYSVFGPLVSRLVYVPSPSDPTRL